MADSDRLRSYVRAAPPVLPDQGRYIAEELKRIEHAVASLIATIKALEVRIEALENP